MIIKFFKQNPIFTILAFVYIFFRFGYIFMHLANENNFFQSPTFFYFEQLIVDHVIVVTGIIVIAKYIAFEVKESIKR